jgi:hypothetical protein
MITCSLDKQKNFLSLIKRLRYQDADSIVKFGSTFLGHPFANLYELIQAFTDEQRTLINHVTSLGLLEVREGNQLSLKKATTDNSRPLTPSNFHSLFTMVPIAPLFTANQLAKDYFSQTSKNWIMTALYLGNPESERYPTSSMLLNAHIRALKNGLVEKIALYLSDVGTMSGGISKSDYFDVVNGVPKFKFPLYTSTGFNADNVKHLQTLLTRLEIALLGTQDEHAIMVTDLNRKIPNLKGSINNPVDRKKFDAYNAAILLMNFDYIISKDYSDLMSVNQKFYNAFEEPIDTLKYTKKVRGLKTEYFKGDDVEDDSTDQIQDKLTHKIVEIIPMYGKDDTLYGGYLKMADIVWFGAVIRNFELQNYAALIKKEG